MQRENIALHQWLGAQELQEGFHVPPRRLVPAIDDGRAAEPYRMSGSEHGFRGRPVKIEIAGIVARAPERLPVRLVPHLEPPIAQCRTKARVGGQLVEEAPDQHLPALERRRW